MKINVLASLAIITTLFLTACGSAPASTTEPPADTPTRVPPTATENPTATSIPPTSTPLPTTNIVIDGKADDWEKYPVNIADPTGDQKPGMADLIEARYFMNDKFLYMLIKLENSDKWDDMAFALGFPAKLRGQLNIRPNHHVDAGFYGEEFVDLPVDMEAGEYIELKIPLDRFPAKLQGIFGIAVYNHNQSGNDPVDDTENADTRQLSLVKEIEAIASADGSAYSGELTLDTIWSGEVHVSGDITLSNGVILTIEPGTTVYLASNSDDMQRGRAAPSDSYLESHNDPVRLEEWDQNAITIDGRNGTINAIGTADNPIVFRPEGDSTSSAQWDGIYIEKGAIKYAKVLYAGRTAILITSQKNDGSPKEQVEIAYNEVRFYHWAGIDSHTYNVWIHHNIVEGGGHQAMTVGSGSIAEYNFLTHCQNAMFIVGVDVIVRNNIAVDCARGLQISQPRIPAGSEISITNNTVVQVQGPPDGWYYQGKLIYPPHAEQWAISNQVPNLKLNIQNNIISGPFKYGINLISAPGSGSVVDYNLFWGAGQNFNGNNLGNHNQFSDPLLTDDYHLLSGSPAIDAGTPGMIDADGSPADLGAFGGDGTASVTSSASTSTPTATPVIQSTNTLTKTPTSAPASACLPGETQLFASDFESGVTGWEFDPASGWTVGTDGASKFLQGVGHATARVNTNWDQVIWRLKVKIVSGRVQFGFRVNGDQRYTIVFDGKNTRLVGSTGTLIDQGGTSHKTGVWYLVEIGFQNNALKVTTDGEVDFTFNDSAPIGPGGISMEVLDDSTFQFDDIRVCQP